MAICHPGELWSPREKEDAIDEIEHRRNRYYVLFGDVEADIEVVDDPDGKYLRTVADLTVRDNLESLPGRASPGTRRAASWTDCQGARGRAPAAASSCAAF